MGKINYESAHDLIANNAHKRSEIKNKSLFKMVNLMVTISHHFQK